MIDERVQPGCPLSGEVKRGGSTLDTSGAVALPHAAHGQTFCSTLWSDLTPFQQGYVEALFASYQNAVHGDANAGLRFSDLAPEALALIQKDCERVCDLAGTDGGSPVVGAAFWRNRQGGTASFPPLTVTLGDDGKVHLRAAR
jgi:hypothetical protein